jgi:hypothetical protein
MSKAKTRISIKDLSQKTASEISEEDLKKIRGGKEFDSASPILFKSTPKLAGG